MESGIALEQAANFLINQLDLVLDVSDHLLMRLLGDWRGHDFAIQGMQSVLVTR